MFITPRSLAALAVPDDVILSDPVPVQTRTRKRHHRAARNSRMGTFTPLRGTGPMSW
jgi:hypothetical protein